MCVCVSWGRGCGLALARRQNVLASIAHHSLFAHSLAAEFAAHTQVVTVDMMDSLIGYEIPVKFLEVDEVCVWLWPSLFLLLLCKTPPAFTLSPCAAVLTDCVLLLLHRSVRGWCSATSAPAWPKAPSCRATRCE